jgi:hypothetical protein
MKRETGEDELSAVAGEEIRAFILYPLPPRDPPLDLNGDLELLLDRARALLQADREEYQSWLDEGPHDDAPP